jgi:hypothetical protein
MQPNLIQPNLTSLPNLTKRWAQPYPGSCVPQVVSPDVNIVTMITKATMLAKVIKVTVVTKVNMESW